MARRGRAGTAIRKSWDVARIGRGLARQGADLRHWVSYATVAAVDDDGEVDLSNPNAVVITPGGVDVDVVLEPSGYPMTCKHGVSAGTVYVCGPIKVGDQVIVEIPDGDVSMVGKISSVISGPNGEADAVPVGPDGLPLFKNDRYLVFAKGVPIDLRTDGGARLLVNPDGTIQVGDGADQAMVRGTAQRSAEAALNSTNPTVAGPDAGLQGIWADAAAACVGPLAALKPFFLAAALVIKTYEGQASGFLSPKNKTI